MKNKWNAQLRWFNATRKENNHESHLVFRVDCYFLWKISLLITMALKKFFDQAINAGRLKFTSPTVAVY